MTTVHVEADVPPDLLQSFLQTLRTWESQHPHVQMAIKCNTGDASARSAERIFNEMDPPFPFTMRVKPREAPMNENEDVVRYWLAHYVSDHGLCSLCGNTGVIDTRGRAISPAGIASGRLNFCICPNGQTMRLHGVVLDDVRIHP